MLLFSQSFLVLMFSYVQYYEYYNEKNIFFLFIAFFLFFFFSFCPILNEVWEINSPGNYWDTF